MFIQLSKKAMVKEDQPLLERSWRENSHEATSTSLWLLSDLQDIQENEQ